MIKMETWFKYTALPQSNCTRIVFLHAASAASEPLECTLEERLLDGDNRVSGEPFAALSYTWGRPGSGHYIKCEGKKIPITENCDAALRHIRSIAEEQPQALWVDAICIDQSNVDERSLQVQIFHHIYASAERTWVWLGEKTQHTEHAVKILLLANNHGLHLFKPRNYQPVIFHDAHGFKDLMLEVAGNDSWRMYLWMEPANLCFKIPQVSH
jgi:Heterokaryon incompatibility protein (HET)